MLYFIWSGSTNREIDIGCSHFQCGHLESKLNVGHIVHHVRQTWCISQIKMATPKSKPKAKAKPKSATKPSSIEAVDDPVMKYMDVDVSDAIEVQKVKKRLHSCVYRNEVKRRLKNDVPRDQAKLHGQTAAAQVVGRWNVILNLAEAEDVD